MSLTDEELAAFETPQWADIRRLVEEVKRLRSEEWLEKAAEEIHAERHDDGYGPSLDQIRAILRKHRDGK